MLITQAFADTVNTATAAGGENMAPPGIGFGSLWVFVFIIIIMYFLMIKPQQQQQKKRKQMIDSLKRGDKIITAGGMVVKVKKVIADSDEIIISLSDEGPDARIIKSTISEVVDETTTVKSK